MQEPLVQSARYSSMSAATSHSQRNPKRSRQTRKRTLAIDLNQVPSAMEQLAESWKGNR